jgi:hypothetical protein
MASDIDLFLIYGTNNNGHPLPIHVLKLMREIDWCPGRYSIFPLKSAHFRCIGKFFTL